MVRRTIDEYSEYLKEFWKYAETGDEAGADPNEIPVIRTEPYKPMYTEEANKQMELYHGISSV